MAIKNEYSWDHFAPILRLGHEKIKSTTKKLRIKSVSKISALSANLSNAPVVIGDALRKPAILKEYLEF